MQYADYRSMLADAKFYESYSRFDPEKGRYESWEESVSRVMAMHRSYYESKMTPELEGLFAEVESAYREKLVLGAQRALQFGGAQLLKNHAKMYNCTSSYADRPAFFGEAMWLLLCGCGVGFSVQKHHVARLPKVAPRTKQPKAHVVEDSIEGWATAIDVLMSSFFENGGKHPEYRQRKVYFDLSLIRPRGAMISGGFKAPGPDPLRRALDRIEHLLTGLVIQEKLAELRPIHVYDVLMHASDAVLSGGVRRSATICLFSPDDMEMARAKTGNWYNENPQRARSNNSVVIKRDEVTREQFAELMKSIREFGEPGFFFVDDLETCTNPCVEIGMFPQIDGRSGWQGCNLTEINGGMCTDRETFLRACRASAILGTLQAGYTKFGFLGEESQRIFEREALLGTSITGWMNSPDVLFDETILEEGAELIKRVNAEVAEVIGINPAARTCCVKPSGSASILLGTASGIHPEHSKMYLRHVQMNKEGEVARLLARLVPNMIEESVWSAGKTDYVVAFPIIPRRRSLLKNSLYGVSHLDLVKKAQRHWVEAGTRLDRCANPTVRHNVSNTIVVDDWDEVEEYVYANRHFFAGISFLPQTGDKDFNQAPNTEVLSVEELIERYGTGSVFASGLIVEALKVFAGDLWTAISTAHGFGLSLEGDHHDNNLKREWVRRFEKFTVNYFDGDSKRSEYCLKDVYLLHKWEKIQQTIAGVTIDWQANLTEIREVDADTLAAQGCYAGACEV
jgi:ribonucleoside-triphosphate reductase (thioredoxin)